AAVLAVVREEEPLCLPDPADVAGGTPPARAGGWGGGPPWGGRGGRVRLAGAASRTRRRILLVPSWVQAAPNALRAAAGAHSIGHLMAPQKPEVGEATPRSAIRCRDSVSGRSWPAGRPAATNGSHMLR